jgi:hypothetical protein
MANESIDKLAALLAETVPQGLRSARDDLEENFRAVLNAGIGKLDLVTREEFEVQQAVLARTRQKLEALEARLASMETGPDEPAAKNKATKKKAGKKKTSKKKTTKSG